MEFTKEIMIEEVRASRIVNVPFTIILQNDIFEQREESNLILNRETCNRFKIPISLDLVKRILIFTFKSRELPLVNQENFKGTIDMTSVGEDDLLIVSLAQIQTVWPAYGMIPPAKHHEINQQLKLASFGRGNTNPCPFYRINIGLTYEEYKECKELPPTSIFNVNFKLA